jgi:hypothetical protein
VGPAAKHPSPIVTVDRGDRILLLEFVNADQLPGRTLYFLPLLAGVYSELGASVRWLRFGLATTHFLEHNTDAVVLPREEMTRLLQVVRELQPTLLLCSDILDRGQRRQIERHAPGVVFFEGLLHARSTASLPGLSQGGVSANLDRRSFLPRYDWEPGNEAASRREIDNIYLVLRESCGHWLPVARAPQYAGIKDWRVTLHRGCTFCLSGCRKALRAPPGEHGTPVSWIRKQFSGIAGSRGSRLPYSVLLESLPSAEVLRLCLAEMRTAGMETVRIQLGVRTNLAPHVDRILREHFARHPSSRMKIGVYASGIESFDSRELQLFNKGTTLLDNLRAINIYRKLSREYGDRFSYYGLSMILFTPWTTLDGLDLNLGLCRALGLGRQEIGNLFQSRLRLHPELPLTALAERQGLILQREPDALLRMNRRKLFSAERAWRFADRRLRALCRLVLRYDLLESPLADPLARDFLRRLNEHMSLWNGNRDDLLLDVTRCSIEVLRSRRTPLQVEALVERSFELWRKRRIPRERPRRIGPRRVRFVELLDRLADVVTQGVRGVCSIDDVAQAELDAVAKRLERRGMRFALVDRRGQPSNRGTLFIARRRETLARRIHLERVVVGSTGASRRDAILEAGLLHGYPECCARAYADSPFAGSTLKGWASFARRAETPGRIPAAFQPFFSPELGFVPCRADCAQALENLRRAFALLGDEPREDRAYLCSLDGRECRTLRVIDENGDSLEIEPESSAPAGRRVERSRRRRRVHVTPAQIRILAGNEPAEVLTATHGIWWSKRCFFPAEWTEMALAAAWLQNHAGVDAATGVASKFRHAPAPERRGGLVFSVVDPAAAGSAYVFRLARHKAGCSYLLRCGPLVLWYSHRDPIGRSREFARALATVMRRFSRRPLSAASVGPWREAFGSQLDSMGLLQGVQWSVSWFEDCDADVTAPAAT